MSGGQSHVPADQNRGRKRKHDEAGGADGATSEPCGEDCEQMVENELAGSREESDSEASSRRASSSAGDDCEGADDESSKEEEEETISDRDMLDNRLQQVDFAQDHRRADQERELGADQMAIAARALVERGYVVFSANTQWDPESKDKKGGKIMKPPSNWPETTLANCLSQYFDPHQNTLLINTTASGILVADFDLGDGGMEQLAEWESVHGAFTGPRVRTGSGGVHLYFSHKRSLEAGLAADTPTHFAKLKLKVLDPITGKESIKKVGVDMRGVSSNGMIACPPSSYQRMGEPAQYTVVGGGELPAVDDLPPLPDWFITILNERTSRTAGGANGQTGVEAGVGGGAGVRAPSVSFRTPDLSDTGLQQGVVEVLRGILSSYGDNTSVFSKAEASTVAGSGAVIYHFRNGGGQREWCPYLEPGAERHYSNNFGLLRRGTEITYVCHSERCKGAGGKGNKKLGRLPFPVAAAFSDAEPLNSERDRLYEDRGLFPISFLRKNLSVLSGDEGGAQVIDRLQTYTGHKVVFSNEKWYYWNGSVWMVDPSGRVVSQVCRRELNKISAAYQKESGAAVEQNESEDEGDGEERSRGPRGKKKKEKLVNFNFNAKMSNIMTTLKGYCLDSRFEELLNSNRDALPLVNGVILFQSAELVPHHPKYLWSFKLDVRWPSTGLLTPLGRMGEFLAEITHTPEALAYLQRILGYGITGHISNQVMLTMIGEGGAGKSLLLALLKRVIGPFYKDVSKDMLVTSKGQRPLGKGAANPDEAGLRGIRIAVCTESDETDEFAEGNLKRLTGEATITSRALYADYVTFATTQLHILCTNYPPRAKRWTIALKRRLLTLVFPMRFFYSEESGYNPANPHHGVRDPELEDVLKAEVDKLLVFLVQGARDWYRSGKRLLEMPEASKKYMESWEQANDPFAAFLKEEGTMNVKAFETSESLMQAYNNPDRLVDGVRFEETGAPSIRNATELGKFCRDHGLEGPGRPSELRFVDAGHQFRGYRGFKLNESTPNGRLER